MRRQTPGQLCRRLLEFHEPLVGARELGESSRCLAHERHDVGIGLAILALQGLQRADAFTHLLQTLRVGRERLPIGTHVTGQLGDLDRHGRAPGSELRRRRVERASIVEHPRGHAERVGRAVVTAERRLGRTGRLEQALDVAEPRLLGGQPLGLLGLRRDRLDLADLIGEEVELTLAIARRHPQPLQGDRRRPERLERLAVGDDRDEVLVAGEPIEERGLHGGLEEPLGLMLAVHLDQRGAERGQCGGCRDLPADARSPLPSTGTARASSTSPSSAQSSSEDVASGDAAVTSNKACTRAALAPSRTSEEDARAPSARERPTVIIVLPAPVSPVRTFRPGCSGRSRSSMTPSPEMWSSRSTRAS